MSKPMMRLAFREEGQWWNVYAAETETMKDAVLIASIAMAAVQDLEVKNHFMLTMRLAFGKLLSDLLGGEVSWPDPPQPAPEHERSGHG